MRINRASAIMLAAQGLLTRREAGAILQALDDIERSTDVRLASRARALEG
jgi:argininosuccinate lyase